MRPQAQTAARRIAAVQDALAQERLDALLVTYPANVRYISGFPGHDASILIGRTRASFITDARYIEEARDALSPVFDVRLAAGSLSEIIDGIARRRRLGRVGFESAHLPYAAAMRLRQSVGNARLTPAAGIIERLRMVKDAGEIAAIRRSVALTKRVFARTVPYVAPGVTERSIAARIETAFIRAGALASFETIVARGANASKPHARSGDAAIRGNGFVMIDMGCRLDGYCSDLTRMVTLGDPGSRFRRIYRIVAEAQEQALRRIRPGVPVAEIDRAARRCIASHGFGRCFSHSLGHGVGLEIHESPTVSWRSAGTLCEGAVCTVEPAIYLPGFGGVRIEDMVLVTKNGYELLTR